MVSPSYGELGKVDGEKPYRRKCSRQFKRKRQEGALLRQGAFCVRQEEALKIGWYEKEFLL